MATVNLRQASSERTTVTAPVGLSDQGVLLLGGLKYPAAR
jgi:hypothetical protein